jgi:hypothetical protein
VYLTVPFAAELVANETVRESFLELAVYDPFSQPIDDLVPVGPKLIFGEVDATPAVTVLDVELSETCMYNVALEAFALVIET